MKVVYDPEVDVLSVLLSDAPVAESDQDKPGVILDYDEAGNMVGFEILDASKRMANPMSVEYAVTPPLRPAGLMVPDATRASDRPVSAAGRLSGDYRRGSRESIGRSGLRVDHFPEFGHIGFQEIVGQGDLAQPRAFERFPGFPARWPDSRQGAAAFGYRDGGALLRNIVEQRQAFRLELGHAYRMVGHTAIINWPILVR